MIRKYILRMAILIILLAIVINLLPSAIATNGSKPVRLYYAGTDELTIEEPTDAEGQSRSFGPSLIISGNSIGTWHSEALVKSISISGSITSSIWVSGIGSAHFEFHILQDNTPTGVIITTSSVVLSQSAQEIIGGTQGVDLDLAAGERIGVEVILYFRGAQCTVYWGDPQHRALININCDSVLVDEPNFRIDSSSKKVTINTTVTCAFGFKDAKNFNIEITGETTPKNIRILTPGLVENTIELVWEWDYGKDDAKPIGEYIVTISVEDTGGNTWSKSAERPIIIEYDEDVVISSEIIQLIIIVIIVVIIVFFIAYYMFLGKIIHGKIAVLKSNTEYFTEYKLLIVSEVLHDLAWYLLLVISLFIFSAAWAGWGPFLVGLNEGLYQTVSVILFLSLAKDSDTRGKRKNLLLSLIIIGTILLFIMAWLSLIPNPAIIIVIIILFILFVLCYYGTDNLELALVTEYFPEKVRGKAYGVMRAIGNGGGLIGGVLSGFLFEEIGFWFCFMLAGFVMLASFFVLFRIKDVGVSEEKISVSDWFSNFVASAKGGGNKLKDWIVKISQSMRLDKIDGFLFNFQNKTQMNLLFFTTLFTLIAYGMIVPFIFVFLNEVRGESATILSIVYTVFGIAIFLPINQAAAGWLCDKFGAIKVYVGAIFAYVGLWGIFNITIPLTTNNALIMAVFIFPIWPFLWIGYKMFVADITPRSERLRGLTAIRLALGIGIVIGSIGGGILLYYISYETVFQLAMLFTFIATLLAVILLRNSKDIEKVEFEELHGSAEVEMVEGS